MKRKPGFDDELRVKGQRWSWPVRSIGRLMIMVAVLGAALSVMVGMRKQKKNVRYFPARVQQRIQAPQVNARAALPRDPFVVVAAAEIDAAMVVPAPAGDEAMVFNPYTANDSRQWLFRLPEILRCPSRKRNQASCPMNILPPGYTNCPRRLSRVEPETEFTMLETENAIEWDFITLVAWWNLYGLPVLLMLVAIAALIRGRSHPATTTGQDSSRIVCRIGLIHCALAVQAMIFLVQALLTLRTMGIPESLISLVAGLIDTAVNPVLAIGLLRRRSLARRVAIAWYAIRSLLGILVIVWRWYYLVPLDLATWPELAVARIMPLFLFVVMFLPRIKRVFIGRPKPEPLNAQTSDTEPASPLADAPIGWPLVSLATLLLLIVVCSNLVADAADWGYRLAFEPESIP